jgi:catechol 2,3-dioxygenase-like lactoylglutathione lyase family enzyme
MQYLGFVWCGVLVENLEVSVSFYRDVLGLRLLGKGEDWAHFEAGGGALFELMSGGKAAHEPKSAAQQPLILGLRVDDLYRAVAELKQKGVEFDDEIGEFENTRWVRFSDPEGNLLEIKEIPEA